MYTHVVFLPGEQKKFLMNVSQKTGLKMIELAQLLGVHRRTLSDWQREKYHMSLNAIKIFTEKFGIALPEKEEILISRWQEIRKEASIKGGAALIKKYGVLGTEESRKKGGRMSWIKRRSDPQILQKYVATIQIPDESIALANLIGIILGDGGLTHFQCKITLNSATDKEFSYYVKDLFIKLFGISPKTYKSKVAKAITVTVSSVNLIQYLLEKGLFLGNKVELQVGVPGWILSRNDYVRACIRGLVDTDGCFIVNKYKVKGKEYQYPKMIFSNKSLPLLDFVYNGLKSLGFSPRKYYDKHVWLTNSKEVRRYLKEVGTQNYKPNVKIIFGEWAGR